MICIYYSGNYTVNLFSARAVNYIVLVEFMVLLLMFQHCFGTERKGIYQMLSADIRDLTETASERLKAAVLLLEPFLNNNGMMQLTDGDETDAAKEYYSGLLADLRHLLVFCEVHIDKLWVLHRRTQSSDEHAARALYEVYHQCVNAFYYPKHECYSEDGRYAYTGQDAMRFRYKPDSNVRILVLELAKTFEELRDELAFYESDYMTKRRMQGQK